MHRLTTLGAVDLRDGTGHPVRDVLAQPKRVALLAYLALQSAAGPVPRDRLLALFWPESDGARARNALSQALHHLRQSLGAEVIASQGAGPVDIPRERLWCDAAAFVEALERGEAELALDLYRGEFCPSLFVAGSPDVERWLDERRAELRRRALAALCTLADRLAQRGDGAGAARTAHRALTMRPDDEGDVRSLLTLLDWVGDSAGALAAYRDYAERLATELETEPDPETKRLAEAIRRRRADMPEAAPEAVPRPRRALAPVPPAAGAGPRRVSRRAVLGATVGAVVILAGAVALGQRSRPDAPGVTTVAVFPFAVRGGATYLHDGMVDLLSAKLDGTAGLRAVDPRSVIAAAAGGSPSASPAPAASARVARRLGAGWYVTGDVVEVAGRLQLQGSLFDAATGSRPLATATVSGDTARLLDLVDELTGRILVGLVRGWDTALTRLAAVTTHSLPALKAFLEGERALRAGQDARAAGAFREAVALDTSFALAQYRLAVTATWVRVPEAENATAWAVAAARHAGRLTPLGRDLLAAYSAYRQVRATEAEPMYLRLTESHPDNVEAWLMLAETWFHYNPLRGRSPMEALPAFQRVLELDANNGHALVHLARLAAAQGDGVALDSLARRYLGHQHRDAERVLEIRALQASLHNDGPARAAVAAEARNADIYVATGVLQAALVYAQTPDVSDLARRFAEAAGDTIAQLRATRRALTDVGLAGGRWGRAPAAQLIGTAVDDAWLLETMALLASDPLFGASRATAAALRDSIAARRPYPALGGGVAPRPQRDYGGDMRAYLLGLLSARLGDTAAARRFATDLSARGSAGPPRGLAHGLRAELARTRGDLRQALVELESFPFDSAQFLFSLAHWGVRERFLRAELLHALRREGEALRLYDSFLNLYDLPWLAVAHMRRGEIHEAFGNAPRARFHYGRAISLWRGCDAECRPLLDRAERALAHLGASGSREGS